MELVRRTARRHWLTKILSRTANVPQSNIETRSGHSGKRQAHLVRLSVVQPARSRLGNFFGSPTTLIRGLSSVSGLGAPPLLAGRVCGVGLATSHHGLCTPRMGLLPMTKELPGGYHRDMSVAPAGTSVFWCSAPRLGQSRYSFLLNQPPARLIKSRPYPVRRLWFVSVHIHPLVSTTLFASHHPGLLFLLLSSKLPRS